MARTDQPRGSVGPGTWRCLELLGGIVGFGGPGSAISLEDVASASHATALQVHMGNSGRPAAVVHLPFNGADQGHGLWSCRGSHRHSVALCSRKLREEAWRSMEVIAIKTKNPLFPEGSVRFSWLRGRDLNPRPLGYEPNELPDCSTPR